MTTAGRLVPATLSAAQQRIVTAALDLFGTHGVSGTSLQMIADAIGVTKAAVYHQFKSKDEVVIAVAESELAALQDAVDAALATTDLTAGDCVTTTTPLVGALRTPREQGLPASLVQRFGGEAPAVVDAAVLPRPLDPIVPGIDVTRAEVEFAVTHEGALDADDILHRRTRIGLVQADADAARPETEAIVGELLG